MNKIRILHIAKYYYPYVGGIEKVVRDYVNALKENSEQMVICFQHEKGDMDEEVDGVKVVRCHCEAKVSSQSLSLSYRYKLKTVLHEFNPNIVLFHYPNPFVSTLLLPLLSDNIRLWVYWHYDITKQKFLKVLFSHQNKELVDRAEKIIVTTSNIIQASKYLPQVTEKCVIIPACINEQRLKTHDTEASRKLYVKIKEENVGRLICLAVGRFVPYKGFKYLVQVSKCLDEQFRFYIIGQGPMEKELKELAGGDNKVIFCGGVDDESLVAYMRAADIYCFPSITKNEAFGISMAEAMYFGKPIVNFTIAGSGVNSVSLNGVTGIECPNADIEAYVAALRKLAIDDELRKKFGENAHERAQKNYTYEQFLKNVRILLN